MILQAVVLVLCTRYRHLDFIFLSLSIFQKKSFSRHTMEMTAAIACVKTIAITLQDLRNHYQIRLLFSVKFRSK